MPSDEMLKLVGRSFGAAPVLFGLRGGSLLENKPAWGTVSPQTEKEPNTIVQLICTRMLLILGVAGINQVSLLHTV